MIMIVEDLKIVDDKINIIKVNRNINKNILSEYYIVPDEVLEYNLNNKGLLCELYRGSIDFEQDIKLNKENEIILPLKHVIKNRYVHKIDNDFKYLYWTYVYNSSLEFNYNVHKLSKDYDINLFALYSPYNDCEVNKYLIDIKDNEINLKFIHRKYYRYKEELKERYKDYNIFIYAEHFPHGKWRYNICINHEFCIYKDSYDENLYLRYKSFVYEDSIFAQIFLEEYLIDAINIYERRNRYDRKQQVL